MPNDYDGMDWNFNIGSQPIEKKEAFWKVNGGESYGNGYVVTHIVWPSDRLVAMSDHGKTVLVPIFDIRRYLNTKSDFIRMSVEDSEKNNGGILKYIYTFEIEGYEHLFGLVAFKEESEPVTDFFKDISPLRNDMMPSFGTI